MIIITLAGDSSRFFSNGFTIVKYKLPFGRHSVIEHILDSISRDEFVLLVLNSKFNDANYITSVLESLKFEHYKVVEITKSKGQLESALLALNSIKIQNLTEPLAIFNGDTIRKIPLNSNVQIGYDGEIEIFNGTGTHWSFVDRVGDVHLVAEKDRISDYCCSGLYKFSSIQIFLDFGTHYLAEFNSLNEYYIAPVYNILLSSKKCVYSKMVDQGDLVFCGTPEEYEMSKLDPNSKLILDKHIF